jgi:hypothetical protein
VKEKVIIAKNIDYFMTGCNVEAVRVIDELRMQESGKSYKRCLLLLLTIQVVKPGLPQNSGWGVVKKKVAPQ